MIKKQAEQTEVIKIRLGSEDKVRLQVIAETEFRTFSDQCRLAIREWLKTKSARPGRGTVAGGWEVRMNAEKKLKEVTEAVAQGKMEEARALVSEFQKHEGLVKVNAKVVTVDSTPKSNLEEMFCDAFGAVSIINIHEER